MDNFVGNDSGEDYDEESNLNKGKKPYHRHSTEQIQRLEAYFKDVPHPDESQRRQLGQELGLEPRQIKFWFQNKRTQAKTQNERADNNSLRMENERMHCENIALKQALKNIICPNCDGPALSDLDRYRELEMLHTEHSRQKNEYVGRHEQLTGLTGGLSRGSSCVLPGSTTNSLSGVLFGGLSGGFSGGISGGLSGGFSGKPDSSFEGLTNEMGHPRSTSLSPGNILSPGIGAFPLIGIENPLGNLRGTLNSIKESPLGHLRNPPIGIENTLGNLSNSFLNVGQPSENSRNVNPTQYHFNEIRDIEKSAIIELCLSSVDELVELAHKDEPLWIKSPSNGSFQLVRDSYDKLFPKANRFKTSSARVESSKDSGVVAMNPLQLVNMFMDPDQWMNMFPNMVTKASIIDKIDTENIGGSMYLMHAKMHILSPLVPARDFIFVRYVRKLDQTVWMMVDVSYDIFKELHDPSASRAWRHPSGCVIQDLCNGSSKVTWIENVQVDDKSQTHRLYRDLVCVSQAYGANRWIVTLQRMCERVAFYMGTTSVPRDGLESVIQDLDVRRNFMKLSHRMVKSFCENLCPGDKIDFPNMSEMNISGVRISVRKNEEPGAPIGLILSAASSMWFPLSVEQIFNFLIDEKARGKWDIMANGNPVHLNARIATGSNFLANNVSVLQAITSKEHVLLLQESFIDSLGALIVYAPMDLGALNSTMQLENPDKVSVLPTGFVISSDGRCNKAGNGGGASGSSSASNAGGSLLTVSYQILANVDITKHIDQEFVASVHSLISSTIQKIKGGLRCDFD